MEKRATFSFREEENMMITDFMYALVEHFQSAVLASSRLIQKHAFSTRKSEKLN